MTRIILALGLCACLFACGQVSEHKCAPEQTTAEGLTLSNENITVVIAEDGSLASLKNNETGKEYASGEYLWRMYYDAPHQKELQITGAGQNAAVEMAGDRIVIKYDDLRTDDGTVLDYDLTLTVSLEPEQVRFASEMTNNVAHTVIREFQYPLVRDINMPEDYKLITAQVGGKIYDNPRKTIIEKGFSDKPYKRPDQVFRQLDCKYPTKVSMNCYTYNNGEQGL